MEDKEYFSSFVISSAVNILITYKTAASEYEVNLNEWFGTNILLNDINVEKLLQNQ
jgi:hypothetical protein